MKAKFLVSVLAALFCAAFAIVSSAQQMTLSQLEPEPVQPVKLDPDARDLVGSKPVDLFKEAAESRAAAQETGFISHLVIGRKLAPGEEPVSGPRTILRPSKAAKIVKVSISPDGAQAVFRVSAGGGASATFTLNKDRRLVGFTIYRPGSQDPLLSSTQFEANAPWPMSVSFEGGAEIDVVEWKDFFLDLAPEVEIIVVPPW